MIAIAPLIRASRVAAVAATWVVFLFAPGAVGAQAPADAGVPVRLEGETLFTVHAGIGPFTAEQRANATEEKIANLALNPFVRSIALEQREFATHTDIVNGDEVITSVTDDDAVAEGAPRASIAVARFDVIRTTVETRRATYFSPRAVLIGVALTLLFTLVLWLVVRFASRWLRAASESIGRRATETALAKLRRVVPLPAARVASFMARLLDAIRALILATAIVVYIPVVLSFFPRTRYVSRVLVGYVVDALARVFSAFGNYLPNLIFLIVISVLTYYAIRLVRLFFSEVGRGRIRLPDFEREWAAPTAKIASFLLVALGLVMAFPYLPGSDSEAFKGVSLFLGLLLSLASSSAISNMIAGVILTYTGAFRVGDRVTIAGSTGDVIDKTLLVTRLRTIKNEDVAIPNTLVLNGHIVNFSSKAKTSGLILHTSVTIGYDAPWRTVHELLIAAAKKTDKILDEPPPFVLQTALNDFFVTYEINAYTRSPQEMVQIYADLHANIQDSFNEAGVEIMSPHYTSLRDGNTMAIPEEYRPPGYTPPGFKVER